MTKVLLAIDIGGSTSRATLVDRDGNCLGQGRDRGGNPGSNPPEQAAAAIIAAVEAAVTDAGGGPFDIQVALMAMAGPRNPLVQQRMEDAFRRLGLSGPMVFLGDLDALLPSVTAATEGYGIVCGTGAGAVRVRGGTIEKVVDAAGWLLGDLGSGYWLGHHAAIAVTAALEGRGPETALTGALLGHLGIGLGDEEANGRPQALRGFIDAIYKMRPIEMARFAPLVIATAADPVADDLLRRAVAFLVADFRLVFDPDLRGPVVLGGSVSPHLPGLKDALAEVLRAAGHEPDIRFSGDGAVGAAVLALRQQGIGIDEAMVARVAASVAAHAARKNPL